jgi:hypothetical protein
MPRDDNLRSFKLTSLLPNRHAASAESELS